MSTLTMTPTAIAADKTVPTGRGVIARLIERTTEAQTARARRIVYRHLAAYNDKRLAELGFSAAEIAEIRKIAPAPISFWA